MRRTTIRQRAGPLFGNEKILREGPLIVDPLRFATEAGGAGHGKHFLQGILVAAFGPDGFTFREVNGEFGGGDVDGLRPHGSKVHFNATRLVVNLGDVFEVSDIKIGFEFAVDAVE